MPMKVTITPTRIDGILLVETGIFHDARGYFTESYSEAIWREAGFTEKFVQDNISRSCKGTMRGMHYQLTPSGMGKLVRCITGAVHDVAVDLRKGSPTFGQWIGYELSGENGLALWIPVGFAHGFVALEEDTIVHYKCSGMHSPENERALSYKDPAIGIEWQLEPTVISEKDENAPTLDGADYDFVYKGAGE